VALTTIARNNHLELSLNQTADNIMRRLTSTMRIGDNDLRRMLMHLSEQPIGTARERFSLANRIRQQVVVENIEEIRDLHTLCLQLKSVHPLIGFPCTIYKDHPSEITVSTVSGLACILDEYFSRDDLSSTDKLNFAIQSFRDIQDTKNETLRQLLIDQVVGVLKGQNLHNLNRLAELVEFMSPQYDKTLSRIAKVALDCSQDGNLRIASKLLSIESEDLREQILSQYIPKWIEASEHCDIEEFLGSCPVTLPIQVLNLVRDKIPIESGNISLMTLITLAPVIQPKAIPGVRTGNLGLKELSHMAKILSKQTRECVVIFAPHVMRVVPFSIDTALKEDLRDYIVVVGSLCKRLNVTKLGNGELLGPIAALDKLAVLRNVSMYELTLGLELAITVESLVDVSRFINALLHRHETHETEKVPRKLKQMVEILRVEYPQWFTTTLSDSMRAGLATVVRKIS
jgi:hypothetical protein